MTKTRVLWTLIIYAALIQAVVWMRTAVWPAFFPLALYLLTIERIMRGRYRSTQAHHRHPQDRARPLARAYYALTGGSAASPRVTYEDTPILAVKRARLVDANSLWEQIGLGLVLDWSPHCWVLASVTGRGHYPAGTDEATCGVHGGCAEAPAYTCTCGFYAVPADQVETWPFEGYIIEVELSGLVIEHERGYRAQYQTIVGIYEAPDPFMDGYLRDVGCSRDEIHAQLEARYGVPVRPWKEA